MSGTTEPRDSLPGSCYSQPLTNPILEEFCRVSMDETFYASVDALQQDVDAWLHHYNTEGLISDTEIRDEGSSKPSMNSLGKKVKRTVDGVSRATFHRSGRRQPLFSRLRRSGLCRNAAALP